jgi:hypothetical protein
MRLSGSAFPILMAYGLAMSQANNTLTQLEKDQGFQLLFDGTLQSVRNNFVAYQQNGTSVTTLPANIAVAPDSSYFVDNNATQDIRSKAMYADFELKVDYRISDNAGIFYRANLLTGAIFENTIEYPLYNGTPTPDDMNAPGAAYDIYPPMVKNYKNFATGAWNTVRIRVFKDSVYHWHNDVMSVKFKMQTDDYNQRLSVSKWKDMPCFAVEAATQSQCAHSNPYRTTGYIGFQTAYPGQLYLRNLKIAKYPFASTTVKPGTGPGAGSMQVQAGLQGLDVRVGAREDFRLGVYSPAGKKVAEFRGSAGSRSYSVPAGKPGLYLLRFDSEHQSFTRKAILN